MRARSSCEPQLHVIPAINFRYFTDGADEDISAVADASVFPRTPGPLMVGAVYMVAEKAAGVILRDAKAIR